MFAGVPVKLGEKGMEQVIEIKLSTDEKAAFMKSVDAVRQGCEKFM
jgi:malate dehydrogenase